MNDPLLLTSVSLNLVALAAVAGFIGKRQLDLRRARQTIARVAAERVSRETSPIYVVLGDRRAAATWAANHTDQVHPSRVLDVTGSPARIRGFDVPVGVVDLGRAFAGTAPIEEWDRTAAIINRTLPIGLFPRDLPFNVYWPGFEGGQLP